MVGATQGPAAEENRADEPSIEISVERTGRGVRFRVSIYDHQAGRILGGHPSFDPLVPGHWRSIQDRLMTAARELDGGAFDEARFLTWFESIARPQIDAGVREPLESPDEEDGPASPVDLVIADILGDETIELWCDRDNPDTAFLTTPPTSPANE